MFNSTIHYSLSFLSLSSCYELPTPGAIFTIDFIFLRFVIYSSPYSG